MVGTAMLVYVSWLCWLSDDVVGSTPSTTPHPKHPNMDNINKTLDNVLSNPRLRENYIRCFLDKGICSKEALQLKHILSDALNMNCTNCTADQKFAAEKFLKYVIEKEPLAWEKLKTKYDSTYHDHNDSDASKENHNSMEHHSGHDSDEDEQAHGHYHNQDRGNSSGTHGTKSMNDASHNKKGNATMATGVKT